MCCTGRCKWEVADLDNGATRCVRPQWGECPYEDDDDDGVAELLILTKIKQRPFLADTIEGQALSSVNNNILRGKSKWNKQ